MRKRIEWKWEILEENPASSSKRVKVMGGWIVVHQTYYDLGTQKATLCESSVFLADKDHEWCILPPTKEEVQIKQDKSEEFSPK